MKKDVSDIYFKNLLTLLNKTYHLKIFYLPGIHSLNSQTRDYDNNRFKYFFNLKKLFDQDYFIFDKKKLKKSRVVFLTHYLGKKLIGEQDFYYGKIFKFLNSKKIDFTVIMLNKSTQSINQIKENSSGFKYSTVIINNYSHPIKDFKIIIYTIFLYIRFLICKNKIKFNYFEKKIIKKKINLNAFLKARTSLKIFNVIKKILSKYGNKVNKFITTYEGHVFEKLIFDYCQKKEIISFGYFFSVIRKQSTCIFYPYPKKITPNKVFVTGGIIKNFFSKKINLNRETIIIGSGRKFIKKKFYFNKLLKKKLTVLFCPEGIYPESVIMYNLAVKISKINAYISPVIRFHPEIDQKKLFNDKKILENNSNNVEISHKNLDDDILRSEFLIYRGSSMCINAVFAGVFPIYFKLRNEKSIDPLFEVNNYTVTTPDELVSLIMKIKDPLNAIKIRKYMSSLFNYSLSYFEKINKKNIIKNI
jgi:hypothetical protein